MGTAGRHVRAAAGVRAMILDRRSQGELLGALEALKGGFSRRFEDRLWLGFGDHWTTLRTMLLRDGCIRELPGDAPTYSLQVKGEALRRRLEESLRSRSEGSVSGTSAISVAVAEARR